MIGIDWVMVGMFDGHLWFRVNCNGWRISVFDCVCWLVGRIENGMYMELA